MLGATFQQTQLDRTRQFSPPEFRRSTSGGRPEWSGRFIEVLQAGIRAVGGGLFAVAWTGLNLLARLGGLMLGIAAIPLLLLGPALVVALLVQLVSTALGGVSAV